MTQSQVLADTFHATRQISLGMIDALKDTDYHKRPQLNGVELNSPIWLVGHLAWAQNMLQSRYLGGPKTNIDWLKEFGFGTAGEPRDDWPKWEEVNAGLAKVHELCMDFWKKFPDEKLDEEVYIEALKWKTSARGLITHSIRHEGMHAGHLSWLKKLAGKKTF